VPSFVSLDLELTPSSGDQQKIIEIGAARFRGGVLDATFSTLVNPGCDLDPRVVALTGIRQHDLADAPLFSQVLPQFTAFVGDDLLIGQSINFDLEGLSKSGLDLGNPAYDTFELASMLIPGLASYDLASIGRSLGVQPEQEHRALGDALVAGRVFLALTDRAAQMSLDLLTQINALAAQLQIWPLSKLFAELLHDRVRSHFTASPARVDQQAPGASSRDETDLPELIEATGDSVGTASATSPARRTGGPIPIEPGELAALLRPGGAVAAALPGFEERPEQLRMMEAVTEAFNKGEHLLVEAGTGTGKSLAYLLPSIYYSVRNGCRVVVSTNTINLQDQLFGKDIPAMQGCLPVTFKAALLKGRGNYLCLRRWQVLSRSPNLTQDEILLLIRTLIWLAMTETGDKSEINLPPPQAALWSRVSAQAESCAFTRCPQFRKGNCFVTRARKKAERAQLIVVNHALLLSDLAMSGGVLPEYTHLVVDEAHHLEEEATDQLGFDLGWDDLRYFLANLHQETGGRRPAGFLPETTEIIARSRIPAETTRAISVLLSSAGKAAEDAMVDGKLFFDAVGCFLHEHAEDRYHSGVRLRITSSIRTQPGWAEVDVRWSELSGRLTSLDRQLRRLEVELMGLEDGQIPDRDGTLAEVAGYRGYLERLGTQGDEIISSPNRNGVYWITGGASQEQLSLYSAPLHVGEALNSALFSCKESVVLTSATLTAEGCFDYVKERLSLESASELVLGSPFDYVRSTMLYVVQDIPEPSRPAYQRAVESTVAKLVTALEGRTLVLFTSHAQLRLTNSAIRSRLEDAGILVLAHGVDGSRRRLLQAFKSAPRAVLMGTSSFWEGIDVVGDALSCVVIVKLPFAVPTDPIIAARSESFDEPFRQYSVPQTILKFKQGFGRLIRSDTDRGIVVILDSRLRSKFYGQSFIQSVPRCTVRVGSEGHLVEAATDWVGVNSLA
jgi:Rad3-related DNA helicase/DNA polymerase III epsilon subunit-like protein